MNEQTDGAEAQPGPETDLRATVWALADADDALTEDAKLALLEALGDDAPSAPATDGSVSDGNPVYLKSIGVKGFRGVGPEVRIPLKAGPGLVVISGRNGSGKSTVAEALELALTGRSYRWHNRTAVWTHGGRPDLRVQSLHLLHQRGFRDQSTGRFGINCMASPLSVSHCGGNRVPVLPGKRRSCPAVHSSTTTRVEGSCGPPPVPTDVGTGLAVRSPQLLGSTTVPGTGPGAGPVAWAG